jgi:hypothetical protein
VSCRIDTLDFRISLNSFNLSGVLSWEYVLTLCINFMLICVRDDDDKRKSFLSKFQYKSALLIHHIRAI